MSRIGWTECTHCGKEQRTSAKIGNRIKCRREACGRSFKVKIKLPYPAKRKEHGFEISSANNLPTTKMRNSQQKKIHTK